jgi:4-carboxymuconolactone decarboxylase
MADPEARWSHGIAAFARQFRIGPHQVLSYLSDRFGEPFSTELISAAGGAWSPDSPLSQRERSLVVLTALIVQGGVERRLRVHVRLALENGVTREELEALCAFLAVYAGYPRASVALEAIREELDRAR